MTTPRLILASASPIRAKLLAQAGLTVSVQPASIDEDALKRKFRADPPGLIATRLAEAKALSVSRQHPDAIVIGADQVLAFRDKAFGKPSSIAAAGAQLKMLRDHRHVLETALCCANNAVAIWSHREAPSLLMRNFSDDFLEGYLEKLGDAVTGSAGGYQLEGLGAQLFAEISGDYFAILGLPLLPLLAFLRERGAVAS